ncbi:MULTISPECIES: transcriptional regulator TraR [Agrobacterium]|uniref:Transcriptional regulator TraR n=1 Tax=Agrobacterium tumefaciens TaxID=358 RepID=A0AAE6EID4_AGRTU|nr:MULTISPECIES: transcriptional regulator TraR [Agrobacterium]QCL77028.1 transcriptional regulator TraR [Agrobacterium tumefaciens]QCL82535.1 transcriptional regulator TraR [Agrobacterium tumefaciens]CUX71028.1 Transcriptional activator protein TraR [Agrobacterium sp. NCPPB 925]
MHSWLDKLTDISALQGSDSVLQHALENLTKDAGFEGYAYLHLQPGHILAVTNYHPEWRSIYFKQKFTTIDPVVKRARTLRQAFVWSGDEDSPRVTKAERLFYARAAEFDIRSGVTIPVRAANGSMSMFTMASAKPTLNLGRDIDVVAAAAVVGQLHARMCLLPLTPTVQHPAWLDPKEAAYLKWIAVGKTMEEAANLEGVKYNSVKSKLQETRKRLGVHTMSHLVALAIRAHLI